MNPRSKLPCFLLLFLCGGYLQPIQAQWSGGGPDLGWVTVLSQPAGPAGPIFAGTYGGGLWRSDDQGMSWVDVSAPFLQGAVVWSLAYRNYDAEDQLYVGTEFLGLWRTRSFAADAWDDMNTGLQQNGRLGIRGIAIHPHDPQVITVATSSGMWTSNTGGVNWPDSLRWRGGETYEDVVVSPLAPITIFALQSFALYRSPNKGENFVDISAGLPLRSHRDLAIWPGTLDEQYVVTLDAGVFRRNGGAFTSISPTANPAAMRSYAIELDPLADRIYLASERGLWSSEDRGDSWTKHNGRAGEIFLPEIWAMQILESEPARLLLGSFRYGALETGATLADWIPRNQGLRACWVEGVDAWDGGVLAATAHGEIFLSVDGAQSWSNVTGDLDAIRPRDILRTPSGRWLLTGVSGHWLSDDQGQSWREPTTPPTTLIGHRLLQFGPNLYMGTRQGVWHSDDDGEHWTQLADGLPVDDYFALAAAPDGSLAFAAFGDGVYLRRAGASEFQRIATGAGLATSYRDLAFRDGDWRLLFVAADSQLKLWQIDASGSAALRQNLEEGLPPSEGVYAPDGELGPGVERIHWDRGRGALIAALFDQGVYRSDRLGAGWTQVDGGIRVPRVVDLAVDEAADRIYVGTLGSGMWGADRGALFGEETAAPTSLAFRVSSNPVRDRTSIHFELPRRAGVEFTLFDARGRRVRTIHNGTAEAGAHALDFLAEDERGQRLASGRYYLRGTVDGRVHSQGITIVR